MIGAVFLSKSWTQIQKIKKHLLTYFFNSHSLDRRSMDSFSPQKWLYSDTYMQWLKINNTTKKLLDMRELQHCLENSSRRAYLNFSPWRSGLLLSTCLSTCPSSVLNTDFLLLIVLLLLLLYSPNKIFYKWQLNN